MSPPLLISYVYEVNVRVHNNYNTYIYFQEEGEQAFCDNIVCYVYFWNGFETCGFCNPIELGMYDL